MHLGWGVLGLVLLLSSVGCKASSQSGSSQGGGGSGGNGSHAGGGRGSTPPPGPPPVLDAAVALEELAACQSDASDAELKAAIAITDEYAESLHELIGCGQLGFILCSAVIDGVIDAIITKSDDATPDGWQWVGDGVYRTGNAETTMDATFYLAEDFSFAKAGEPVTHDVFLVDSYLVNARLRIDLGSGHTEIAFDEPGPLVELLGFGADPPNPLPVDLKDVLGLKRKLRQLEFQGKVVFQDERTHASIGYTLNVPRMSADKFITGALTMKYELQDVDAKNAELGQTLTTSVFDAAYAMHGALTGTVDFHVSGGPVAYGGHLVWEDTPYPTRTLVCEDPDADGGR